MGTQASLVCPSYCRWPFDSPRDVLVDIVVCVAGMQRRLRCALLHQLPPGARLHGAQVDVHCAELEPPQPARLHHQRRPL